MKKTIVLIAMLVAFGSMNLAAQEVVSVQSNITMKENEHSNDHKFTDKVIAQASLGGAKPICISGGSRTKDDDRGHMGTCSFILNKGVKYRISTGILSEKEDSMEFSFYSKGKEGKEVLKDIQKMVSGRIYSFEFECTKTGKYGHIHKVEDIGKASSVVAIAEII